MSITRGKLRSPTAAPVTGEETDVLAAAGGWRIEQILSGRLLGPVENRLDHCEWVVVLDGSATLEVDGTIESLESGDWVLLDEGVPHRVLSTRTGTNWLAVHLPPGAGGPAW